jgi:hypothetical protein
MGDKNEKCSKAELIVQTIMKTITSKASNREEFE